MAKAVPVAAAVSVPEVYRHDLSRVERVGPFPFEVDGVDQQGEHAFELLGRDQCRNSALGGRAHPVVDRIGHVGFLEAHALDPGVEAFLHSVPVVTSEPKALVEPGSVSEPKLDAGVRPHQRRRQGPEDFVGLVPYEAVQASASPMALKVLPPAPFISIPSDMDRLRGETKTLRTSSDRSA